MKVLFALLFACCIGSISSANVLTVCNSTAYPAQYATIQSAINAATTGDTIYIYPSSYTENLAINKRLVIIGAGIDPRRPNKLPTFIFGTLTISDAAASGSAIMGIDLYSTFTGGNAGVNIDNLVLSECKFEGGFEVYGNNMLIENCILFSTYPTGGNMSLPLYNAIGNVIQNNYFHGAISMRPGTNTIIRNNIFASGDANTVAFSDLQHGEPFGGAVKIYNNIFYKSDPVGPRAVSDACEFKNNIYYLTGDPVPTNAQSSGNINADPLFVLFPSAGAGFSFQFDYHLQSSSPGINYGTDGNDVGMWGGPSPVNAGFEPPVPRIYDLKINNATVPAGGTIQLTVKATKAQ